MPWFSQKIPWPLTPFAQKEKQKCLFLQVGQIFWNREKSILSIFLEKTLDSHKIQVDSDAQTYNLLEGLLQLQPDKRLSADLALSHSFFGGDGEWNVLDKFSHPLTQI